MFWNKETPLEIINLFLAQNLGAVHLWGDGGQPNSDICGQGGRGVSQSLTLRRQEVHQFSPNRFSGGIKVSWRQLGNPKDNLALLRPL